MESEILRGSKFRNLGTMGWRFISHDLPCLADNMHGHISKHSLNRRNWEEFVFVRDHCSELNQGCAGLDQRGAAKMLNWATTTEPGQ